MLFDTVAEYDAEITEVRDYLKNSMKQQISMPTGSAPGVHIQRGAVRDIKEYLELLSKEREILMNRQGGMVTQVIFGSEL